jgi:hypothetical protein
MTIGVIQKDFAPFDSPNNNVVESSWRVYAGLPWHGIKVVTETDVGVNQYINRRPLLVVTSVL